MVLVATFAAIPAVASSSCGPYSLGSMIGVSGTSGSIQAWLASCKGSDVTGLALLKPSATDPGELAKAKELWTVFFPAPLPTGQPITLTDLPPGAESSGPFPRLRPQEDYVLRIERGRSGGIGFGNTWFRVEDLKAGRVQVDGHQLSPSEFLEYTSSQC